jgi:hypothetical protein
MPLLIGQMQVAELARPAGETFSLITDLDISEPQALLNGPMKFRFPSVRVQSAGPPGSKIYPIIPPRLTLKLPAVPYVVLVVI